MTWHSLNLVVLRIGLVYGPYIDFGLSTHIAIDPSSSLTRGCSDKRANCGCRVWLPEEAHEIFVRLPCASPPYFCLLAFRWSPGHNPMHTIHSEDVAGGLWAVAEWMSRVGHEEALKLAGEEIVWRNDKNKLTEATGMPPPEKKIIAPLFNLVSINMSCQSVNSKLILSDGR
jgi:hypothetical protein